MAHRDRSPVHVPLRTSSRNMLREGTTMDISDEDVTFVERKTSKVSRILGADLALHNGINNWNENAKNEIQKARRPSYLSTPDNTSRKNSLVPSTRSAGPPSQKLRVRASSPLLGEKYHSHEPTTPLPKLSKKVQHAGSASNLFSYFKSRESSSKSAPNSSQGLQPTLRNTLLAEPQVTYQQSQAPTKESKRKLRPSRLDLSMLFPKPRNPAPPLLSPQRMTKSPSPASVVSDLSTVKQARGRGNSDSRRLADAPPPRASTKTDAPQIPLDSELSSISEKRDDQWWEQPFERLVGTSEIDLALDRYAGRRSLFSRSSVISNSHEQLRSPRQRTPERGRNAGRAQSPPSNRNKDTHLTPNSRPDPVARVMSPHEESVRCDGIESTRSEKRSVTKKDSKSTLKHRNFQDSSVLCLSSSEDEDDDEDVTPTVEHPRAIDVKSNRNSVATYGEFEPEIFTASTAQAALSPTLRQFERASSTSSQGSHQTSRGQATRRSPSAASTTNKPHNGRRNPRLSAIPTIAEPEVLDRFPQQPLLSPRELKEMNRRSRVIAVTRQEQEMLEAMRQHKGTVTPSGVNSDAEPDRSSMVSAQTRDSFCGSDTSFLRLSAAFPPFPTKTCPNASHADSPSRSSTFDKTVHSSIASPPFSTDYSESLPSPATTGTSPITPTLPIHRFSPLPSPKPPPNHPPPAIPEEQKQHTRRRTDSSEAIMLDDNGEPQSKHDLQVLSFDFDWNHDRGSMAAVH